MHKIISLKVNKKLWPRKGNLIQMDLVRWGLVYSFQSVISEWPIPLKILIKLWKCACTIGQEFKQTFKNWKWKISRKNRKILFFL